MAHSGQSARGDSSHEVLLRFVERFALVLTEHGLPRMPARVFAYALAEDAERYTATELAQGLRVSPAAISGAVRHLLQLGYLTRERIPGARTDTYRIHGGDLWGSIILQNDRALREYERIGQEGARTLGDTPGGRRMRETEEFFAFLRREQPRLIARWREDRQARLTAAPPPSGS